MRKVLMTVPGLLLLAACASTANVPPKVSWSYGAGNGDGVQYPGPAPKYSFAYGVGKDVPVSNGVTPNESYAYGADGTTGDMVQMSPAARQQVAQPAASAPASATHS